MNYLVLLIGFKDLAARGVINDLGKVSSSASGFDIAAHAKSIAERVPDEETSEEQIGDSLSEIRSGWEKVLGLLELKSEFQGHHIKVDVDEIGHELMHNSVYLISFLLRSAGSLLILAHEIIKDEPWHDRSSILEFLRHCRNAAAHGSLFNLRHGANAPAIR